MSKNNRGNNKALLAILLFFASLFALVLEPPRILFGIAASIVSLTFIGIAHLATRNILKAEKETFLQVAGENHSIDNMHCVEVTKRAKNSYDVLLHSKDFASMENAAFSKVINKTTQREIVPEATDTDNPHGVGATNAISYKHTLKAV